MSAPEIVVGMSGGVDSSVAALLLQRQGRRIAGLYMHNWDEDGGSDCRAEDDRRDAVAVCGLLGIPLHLRDFAREYREQVFAQFLAEYAAGRTPNPDVLCNREIKFAHFLDAAWAIGAERIATGHYARTDPARGRPRLLRAADAGKDPSYFLHQLSAAQLAATCFPLGELQKTEVRALAAEAGLPTSAKRDSTGICFIGERDFRGFLAKHLPQQPGDIVDPQGRVLGRHGGVAGYTLGQREGLGLGGMRGEPTTPFFVVGKDMQRGLLVVDRGDSPHLHSRVLATEALHWIAGVPPATRFQCTAQTRYRQVEQACSVQLRDDGSASVRFATAQRAVTPGQSVVFYDGPVCLGGGVIDASDAPLPPVLAATTSSTSTAGVPA